MVIDNVLYTVTGSYVPGGQITITASAVAPFVLAPGATTTWTHTFKTLSGCSSVLPPETNTNDVVTPSVVSAGLGADTRKERGRTLVFSGLAMMLIAGGSVLIRPRGAQAQA